MRKRIAIGLAAIAIVVAGCVEGGASPAASPGDTDAGPTPTLATVAGTSIPRCEDVPTISAPPELYRDDPIYVANEQPVEDVRAWAQSQPGFEEIWLDREHHGWIAVAFSQDAAARQADVEDRFTDIGVVVVAVEWTMAELETLQQRVLETLRGESFAWAVAISPTQGVVTAHLGTLSPERLALLEPLAGELLCIEGIDPADAPPSGPQPLAGDGWRLLADEPEVGESYRTGIASDEASYDALWRTVGLATARPPIDFVTEVVIWFGAVYGSSCPDLRLDDVVVDRDGGLVHADIVNTDPGGVCTADAIARAYVVAVERAKLPVGPFAIQLGAQDPPAGVPEERTVVEVDLSAPGAVAGPGDVHPDASLPEAQVFESGALIEPGFPVLYRLYAHCGVEWLGVVNDVAWRTEAPDGVDFVPPEWRPLVKDDQFLEVSVVLLTEPEPLIEATAGDHTVIYRPSTEAPAGCD